MSVEFAFTDCKVGKKKFNTRGEEGQNGKAQRKCLRKNEAIGRSVSKRQGGVGFQKGGERERGGG